MVMSTATPRVGPPNDETQVTLVDCDVHNHFKDGLSDLMPYLSAEWRRKLGFGPNRAWAKQLGVELALPQNVLYMNPSGIMRRDSIPADGSPPASDPAQVIEQLLDPYGVSRAVLLPGDVLGLGILPDPDLAAAVASAANDWLIDQWLPADQRLRGSLTVAPQEATLGAHEIDRLGDHKGLVQVFFPTTSTLMGERQYYPIYEAAERHGLPICLHPGAEAVFLRGPSIGVGSPTYYIEHHTGIPQVFASNLVSMICNGVFERFPRLKLVIVEGGFAWLPGVLWRLDKNWRSVRDEVPWVKRLPSEYVFESVRFTTQPFVEPADKRQLLAMCEMVQAERTLLFSSDYPHWDFDNPLKAIQDLPATLRQRIMLDNAVELYGERLLS
jgi:predicted TIM-barrel fold metal-dependent hydrolase